MALFPMDRRSVVLSALLAGLGTACGTASAGRQAREARANLYACEGCEAVFEREAGTMDWQARIAPMGEPGEAMRIEGQVLQADGLTPAAGVIVYAHQTNAEGLYANGSTESEWSRRHGQLRGWVKTDEQGRYAFDTIKPAPYPDMTMPAHVHLTVAEPGRRAYYVDDIVFDGEYGVTEAYRRNQELRGGSGIVRLSRTEDNRWLARRDIVLELHSD